MARFKNYRFPIKLNEILETKQHNIEMEYSVKWQTAY